MPNVPTLSPVFATMVVLMRGLALTAAGIVLDNLPSGSNSTPCDARAAAPMARV